MIAPCMPDRWRAIPSGSRNCELRLVGGLSTYHTVTILPVNSSLHRWMHQFTYMPAIPAGTSHASGVEAVDALKRT